MSVRCQPAVCKQTGRDRAVGGNGEAERQRPYGPLVRSRIGALCWAVVKIPRGDTNFYRMVFVIFHRVNRRILLWAGVLFLIGAAPCWVDSLGHAFAYSDWLGLDPKKFPIEAAHRSAQRWMVAALAVQTVGVLLVGQSFWRIRPL